jgi:hypothetical protein
VGLRVVESDSESNPPAGTLRVDSFPEAFHESPEPLLHKPPGEHPRTGTGNHHPPPAPSNPHPGDHHYHLLQQIKEDRVCNDDPDEPIPISHSSESSPSPPATYSHFTPEYTSTKIFYAISIRVFQHEEFELATWIGFWALLNITCANYVLTPMRDAAALQVGVQHMPKLTLASSVMAFLSSVPIGWLFEAPDPGRRKLWKKMGLTRGATQGTSLALFYRFFALSVASYALGFQIVDLVQSGHISWLPFTGWFDSSIDHGDVETDSILSLTGIIWVWVPFILSKLGRVMYIAFFLVVHLMKLHSISLVWGVIGEAMEYEDVARRGQAQKQQRPVSSPPRKTKTRLQRLSMVGFGGTLGGIWGR